MDAQEQKKPEDEIVDPWDYVVPPGKGVLIAEMPYSAGPAHAGDIKTIWNPQNTDEVDLAKKNFNEMKTKGYLAYKVGPEGEKAEQIHQFDPTAGKIIMTLPLKGG